MKKLLKWTLPLLVIAGLTALYFLGTGARGPVFTRLAAEPGDTAKFKQEKGTGNLSYLTGQGARPIKNLPSHNITLFTVQGNRKFRFPVTQTGDLGFYTFLYFNSHNQLRMNFELSVLRKNEKLVKKKIGKIKHADLLTEDLDLEKGDILEISFSGSGFGYFTAPVIYRKLVPEKRDYVFIVGIDTFRKDMLGAKVNGKSITPNIDSFCKDSVDFSHAYAQSSWTLASFMSLFTGLYEFNHNVFRDSFLAEDKPMLVQALSEKFITFSLNGGGYVDRHFGYARGFDYYRDLHRLSVRASSTSGKYLFELAEKIIDRTDFPKLFMFLHTYQIHQPYAPPAEFLKRINPRSRYRHLKTKRGPLTFQAETDNALKQGFFDLYRAEILAFDHYFGNFVTYLKKKGLYNRSMIVFMSDHGEEFFEHHGWEHGHGLYNEQIRVPLMIKFPHSRNAGKVVGENVEVVDIIPTILDYYKINSDPKKIDGRTLNPLIAGKEHKNAVFSSFSTCRMLEKIPPKFTVITGKYKLIFNYDYSADSLDYFKDALPPVTGGIELYDLEKDPHEKTNLAESSPRIVSRMMPGVIKIKKIIKAAFANRSRERASVDTELKKQLESLGYL